MLTTSSCRAHCASAVANPARPDVFLRIPRRGIRSKKEIKRFVRGAGVIRSERWLAECAVARRKSGLFTVRFSGKVSAISLRSSTLSSPCHWTLPRCGLWHSSSFASGVLWEQSPHGLLGPGGVWTGSRLRFCLPTRCAIRSR